MIPAEGMSAASEIAAPALAQKERSERWFFGGMGAAAALTVFAGFARTYYLKDVFAGPPLTSLQHVHGFLFTCWIVLFVAQASLIAADRVGIHRRLGVAGGLLAAAMLMVGGMASVAMVRRGLPPPGIPSALEFFIVPVGDLLLFGAFVGLGLYYRQRPATHKRFMLLATIGLLGAAIARLPFVLGTGPLVFYVLNDLFVAACWLYDFKARGRVHPVFLWGGLIFIASQPLRLALAKTDAWLAFARWVAG
jgi:hypothetical protein